jgi:hypothetical protein
MAQIDSVFTFNPTGATVEIHAGNPSGSTGQNPKAPSDAPVIPPNVVVTGSKLNTTVLSSKVVNPA